MPREREHFQPCVGPTVRGGVWIEECVQPRRTAEENRKIAEQIAHEIRRAEREIDRARGE
jgi:hypothetical protein